MSIAVQPHKRGRAKFYATHATGLTVAALFLAPLMFHFGWAADDWQRLGQGIVVGHLRRKLEADPLRPCHLLTDTGVGYRFQP
mgnify:CR=1 FL=1